MKAVKQIKVNKDMNVNDLIKEFSKAGVMGAGNLGKAVDVLELMIRDKDCKVFLGVAGAMIPGAMQNVIIDFIENKFVDVVVTTGATLTHDLIEGFGFKHIQGNKNMDDSELYKKNLVRMYDSLMQNKVYERLEDFFEENFDEISKAMNIREFLHVLGKLAPKNTVLNTCYRNKIPLFCPAIADSGIGLMIWGKISKGKKINIDAFDDLKEILDISWTAKRTGVFYVCGGVPKNFILQAMQFSKQARCAVQITTDTPDYGGSSGASLKEGISWGKLEKNANYVDLRCDATIVLPMILVALKTRQRKV